MDAFEPYLKQLEDLANEAKTHVDQKLSPIKWMTTSDLSEYNDKNFYVILEICRRSTAPCDQLFKLITNCHAGYSREDQYGLQVQSACMKSLCDFQSIVNAQNLTKSALIYQQSLLKFQDKYGDDSEPLIRKCHEAQFISIQTFFAGFVNGVQQVVTSIRKNLETIVNPLYNRGQNMFH